MPKISNRKATLYDLDKMSVEERTEALKPIVEANKEQLSKLGTSLAEIANSNLLEAIKSFTVPKLPILDLLETIKKMPELPIYEPPQVDLVNFERYDPPVTIKKSDFELEQEAKQAYLTDLHIQLLETQLAIAKGSRVPQYDITTGLITFMGKTITIPLNTKLEMVCRVVLKNITNMKRKWSWDEIIEENREEPENFSSRQIYNATRSINEKVAIETQTKDFLIAKPFSTVQLNPNFLPK
jgi:hypothetical protein